MKHPLNRAERLTLRKKHSGNLYAERWLRYKYAYLNKMCQWWSDGARFRYEKIKTDTTID